MLRHLTSATDGAYPEAALVEGADGMLYGTAPGGGSGGYGTIFRINTAGSAFTVLRHLTSDDGGNIRGGLVSAKDGFLYGVTSGSVNKFFKISTTGVYTALHTFVYNTESASVYGSLIQGKTVLSTEPLRQEELTMPALFSSLRQPEVLLF